MRRGQYSIENAPETRIETPCKPVTDPLRVAPICDQPGIFERAHVARHARLRSIEARHQLADAQLSAVRQQCHGGAASWISEQR